jgi:hypothetical protein
VPRTTLGRHRQHAHDLPRRFALIRGETDPLGQADPLAEAIGLAARARTPREKLRYSALPQDGRPSIGARPQGESGVSAMAKVIIQYVREATEDVIAHHGEAIEEHGMRVLGDPEVELMPEEDFIHIHDAPEVYRLTFEVGPA